MKKPQEYYIPIKGYGMIQKIAKKSGNGGYAYIPAKWAGKKITIIVNEEVED
jgi:putative transposon-encoded protein